MKQVTIAIDPGQTGAMAILQNGKITNVHDMPTSSRLHGKGLQVNPYELSSLLMEEKAGKDATVLIEAVSAMPGQGVASMFRFGESLGVILGVCGALQLPIKWVRPAVWKKAAGLAGKPKDAARTLAIQLHPEVSDRLIRKKDCGRADAICIAHFGDNSKI